MVKPGFIDGLFLAVQDWEIRDFGKRYLEIPRFWIPLKDLDKSWRQLDLCDELGHSKILEQRD
jgi:hypothetical protein